MTKTKQAADHSANNLPPSVERTNQTSVPSAQSYHVAHVLGTGKKNRITSEELCSCLDINRRTLQKLVNEDRRAGAWIISFSDEIGGYCLAESQEEYESFCQWLIKKQLGSVKFFRKQIKDYDVSQQSSILELIEEVS